MPDFAALFQLTVNPWELVLRGTVMYWLLFLLFRFVLRRDVGSIAIADVLLLVLIADAAQNALAGGYESITDGCILVSTIAAWNYLLDWASFRFEAVRRIAQPPALLLVRHGQLMRSNLRKEMVSVNEVMAQLRMQGVAHLSEVKAAYMENDGAFSVIREPGPGQDERRGPPSTPLA